MRVIFKKAFGFIAKGEYEAKQIVSRSLQGIGIFKDGAIMPVDVVPYATWQRLQFMDYVVEGNPGTTLDGELDLAAVEIVVSEHGIRIDDGFGKTLERRPS